MGDRLSQSIENQDQWISTRVPVPGLVGVEATSLWAARATLR